VLADVEQDVAEREPHGARSCEGAGVVTIGKQLSAAPELRVDSARDANRQTLHSTREGAAIMGLRDEVKVVALHGKVHEREAKMLLPPRQSAAHCGEDCRPAQRRNATQHTQRDVQRVSARMRRPAQMGNAGRSSLWRPARIGTRTTPRAKLEIELARRSPHELELALMRESVEVALVSTLAHNLPPARLRHGTTHRSGVHPGR
jgi:hypothetical protein